MARVLFGCLRQHLSLHDPCYGGNEGFTVVLDMIEAASEGLLQEICGADTAG